MQIDHNHKQILRTECCELAVANMVTVRSFEYRINLGQTESELTSGVYRARAQVRLGQ